MAVRPRLFLTFSLALLLAPSAPAAELRTLSGKKFTGDLVALDGKEVTVRTAQGEVKVPVADVLALDLGGQPAPPPPADAHITDVELVDGSLFHCTAVAIKGKTAELSVPPNLTVKVPLSSLSYVLHDANDPKVQEQWKALVTPRGKRDLLVVKRGERLASVEGTFGEAAASGETVAFERASGQKVELPLAAAQGLLFAQRQEGDIPPTLCKVTDAGRNVLVAKSAALSGGGLTVTTVAGVRVEYPALAGLAKLDFSKGKLAFLSDLEPVRVLEVSTDGWVAHYRRDKSLYGGQPIQFGAQAYDKGLTLHAKTVLEYDVGGDYKEFRAVLGVADATDAAVPDSHVRLTIEGDGRELFAAEVRRSDKPRPVALDVRGVRKLRITVASVELFDTGNQMSLADAKVSK
jgi:hypothetical protein